MSAVQPHVGPRTLRATTEEMRVTEKGRALFDVETESGATYTVDLRDGRCSCPDHQYRDIDQCKHIVRARLEMSQVDIDRLDHHLSLTATELNRIADQLATRAEELSDLASDMEQAREQVQEVTEDR